MFSINKSLINNIKYYYSDECVKDIVKNSNINIEISIDDIVNEKNIYNSTFLNINDNVKWYQVNDYINRFINILIDNDLINDFTNKINTFIKSFENIIIYQNNYETEDYGIIIENTSNSIMKISNFRKDIDELIINKILSKYNNKQNFEIIENTSNHISSLSICLSDNIYNNVYNDISLKNNVITKDNLTCIYEYDKNNSKNNEILDIINIKDYVNDIKKSGQDYPLYMGHFMESIIASLLSNHYITQSCKNNETNNIINIACNSVINEVKDKTCKYKSDNEKDEIMNRVNKFVKEIKENHYDKITEYIDKILSKQIELFIKDIEQKLNISNNSVHKMLTKINYSYRGIKGEADYLLLYPENNINILVDCKYYKNIDDKTLSKFTYQLLGYYRQHNIMKTIPTYYKNNNYDINYFMILSPLNEKLEFSYYLCKVDDNILENMINKYEYYVDKCLNNILLN